MTTRRKFLAGGCAWAAALLTSGANAQVSYPSRPIRLIVPQSAGSPVDLIARKLASIVTPGLGVPVIVENRTGASGTIGAAEVARAAADGYTLLVSAAEPLTSAPAVMKVPYEAQREFRFISKLAASTSGPVLVVSTEIHANTLAELIAQVRMSSVPLSYGSFGPGSFPQLIFESLGRQASVKFTEVPYRGSPQALQDLIAGNLQLGIFSVLQAEPYIAAGKLKPLAIADKSTRLPRVPTFAQTGFNGFIFQNKSWVGLIGPAGIPGAAIQRWSLAIHSAMADPEFRKAVGDAGFDSVGNSPEQFAADYRTEAVAIQALIKELGVTP